MDNSISLDISKEVYSERRIVKNHEENVDGHQNITELEELGQNIDQKQYMGKFIVLSKKLNISLGPNYPFFFIGYFMVLTLSSVLLYCSFTLIKNQSQLLNLNTIIQILSVIMTVWINLSYLITALSDPGVYKPGKIYIKETDNLRNCSACKLKVPDNVRHCFTCDICIIDMDHHCPWMSKCVAKGNLKSFYAFIGGMFMMMALFWFTVFRILSQ